MSALDAKWICDHTTTVAVKYHIYIDPDSPEFIEHLAIQNAEESENVWTLCEIN